MIPALIDSELQPLSIENIIKESCYKNHVICFNYNDCKNRLIETFLNSIGVKSTEFNIENTRINRTMSRNEFIMIYFINKFSKNNERLNEILNKLQIDNNRSISFFFFDEVVADKIYSYCDSKEIAYTKIKYSSEVFCSESDFFESLSAEERYTIDIFKNVINFYSIFLEEAVALAIHKEKFYEFSEYKNLVPLNFNLFVYIMLNRDVLFSTCDPYEHYLKFGIEDNRSWCLDLI